MVGVLFVSAAVMVGQPAKADELPVLPAAWHGVWVGKLVITPDKGDPREVPMSLEIAPNKDGDRYAFRITYGEGEKKQVRDYELVPKAGKPGRFEIDEKNGIRLDAKLAGNTLFALFQVGDSLIQSRYERTADGLKVEMTAYSVKDALVTKTTVGGTEVRSPRMMSVQVGELKREK